MILQRMAYNVFVLLFLEALKKCDVLLHLVNRNFQTINVCSKEQGKFFPKVCFTCLEHAL